MEYENNMDQEYKSRTQIKKEAEALQKLGERLLEFTPQQLARIDISENLREAVLFAKTISAREALRRQLQLIGGLMREIDPDEIRAFIEGKDQQSRGAAHAFHQLEQWRDELIRGNDELVEELCRRFPSAERQKLRQLARNAKKEREQETPPKYARQLYRYLRKIFDAEQAESGDSAARHSDE